MKLYEVLFLLPRQTYHSRESSHARLDRGGLEEEYSCLRFP